MKLIAIWAENQEGIIGINNKIPWYNKADLEYFKKLTTGHVVIMGRKTFDSLPKGPLPNRINVVLTRDENQLSRSDPSKNLYFIRKGLLPLVLSQHKDKTHFIIGGSQLFNTIMLDIGEIHRTILKADINTSRNELIMAPHILPELYTLYKGIKLDPETLVKIYRRKTHGE